MIPKQATRPLQSGSKTPGLNRFVLLQALAALFALLAACGLKGGLYIPVEESAGGAEIEIEIEIETEMKTGTGTGTQTTIEIEPAEMETREPESAEKSTPDSD